MANAIPILSTPRTRPIGYPRRAYNGRRGEVVVAQSCDDGGDEESRGKERKHRYGLRYFKHVLRAAGTELGVLQYRKDTVTA